MKGDRKFAPHYTVVSIDAQPDGTGGWNWEGTHKLFGFRSEALDLRRAFMGRLRTYLANGIVSVTGLRQHVDLGRGWYIVSGDGDMIEVCRRSDGCPLYACIHE